jgi:aldehyde:ferredoxin oxidoreductase
LPLSKKSFKVLVSIAHEVTDIETISGLTKISKGEVRACFTELSELGLIAKRGASIFSKLQVSDNGMEAIGAFHRVYGQDDDTIQFKAELQKHVGDVRYSI